LTPSRNRAAGPADLRRGPFACGFWTPRGGSPPTNPRPRPRGTRLVAIAWCGGAIVTAAPSRSGARLGNDHARYHRGNHRVVQTGIYEPFGRCNRMARMQHAFAFLGTHALAQGLAQTVRRVQTAFELVWLPSEISDSEPVTPADYGRAADEACERAILRQPSISSNWPI
jgi:hypothetical protein